MAGNKYLEHDGSGNKREVIATQDGGVGNANEIVALGADGLLNVNMMPSGIGPQIIASVVSFEDLTAGQFVNLFNDGGTLKARKAVATGVDKMAWGYVAESVTAPATVDVYVDDINSDAVGTFAVGDVLFLSASTAGSVTPTAPTGSTEIVQKLGVGTTANAQMIVDMNGDPTILA